MVLSAVDFPSVQSSLLSKGYLVGTASLQRIALMHRVRRLPRRNWRCNLDVTQSLTQLHVAQICYIPHGRGAITYYSSTGFYQEPSQGNVVIVSAPFFFGAYGTHKMKNRKLWMILLVPTPCLMKL